MRDHSNAAIEVLERNLKGRSLERKDFITKNMMPLRNRKYKIGATAKDVDLNAYGDYNRFADPHLRKYHKRKHLISTKHFVPQEREYYISQQRMFSPSQKRVNQNRLIEKNEILQHI